MDYWATLVGYVTTLVGYWATLVGYWATQVAYLSTLVGYQANSNRVPWKKHNFKLYGRRNSDQVPFRHNDPEIGHRIPDYVTEVHSNNCKRSHRWFGDYQLVDSVKECPEDLEETLCALITRFVVSLIFMNWFKRITVAESV